MFVIKKINGIQRWLYKDLKNINMLKKLDKKTNFSTWESIYEKSNENSKIKNTVTEIKNANTGCWESLDRIEEMISNIEDGSVKKTQSEAYREKRTENTHQATDPRFIKSKEDEVQENHI